MPKPNIQNVLTNNLKNIFVITFVAWTVRKFIKFFGKISYFIKYFLFSFKSILLIVEHIRPDFLIKKFTYSKRYIHNNYSNVMYLYCVLCICSWTYYVIGIYTYKSQKNLFKKLSYILLGRSSRQLNMNLNSFLKNKIEICQDLLFILLFLDIWISKVCIKKSIKIRMKILFNKKLFDLVQTFKFFE